MTIASESPILRGSLILENRGIDDEGIKVRCLNCGTETVLRKESLGGYYFDKQNCHTCSNLLAIYENDHLHQPVEYLTIPLYGPMRRQLDTHDDISVINIESDELNRLTKAVYLANRAAKDEDGSFGGIEIDVHDALLVLDGPDVIGYLAYCPTRNDEEMVLRHLFLAKSYRRQGIGSAVVKFWWEDIASKWYEDDGEARYYVESPNEWMARLITSVGHDGEDGDPTAYKHTASGR